MADGAAAAIYLLLAVLAFWHVWSSHPTSYMQVGGDQWRNVWFLAWVPYAIGHGHDPLVSGFVNVPGGVNLMSAAGIPLLGLVFSPVTVIWGPVATYNVCSTAALALSALAAYVLLRRLVGWRPAAFAGGLLYGFSPALITHVQGHLNLAFAPLPPLIFLVLHELVVRQKWHPAKAGALLGVLVVAQFFISSEILFDTLLVAVAALLAAMVVGRRSVGSHARHALRGLVTGVVVAVVLLGAPVWLMLAGPAHVAGKLDLVPQAYRADLFGPLIPDSNQLLRVHGKLLYAADHFASGVGENGSYLGVPLLGLLLVTVVALRRQAVVVVAAVGGIVAFVLSLGGRLTVVGTPRLGPGGTAAGGIPLPGEVLSHLPVLDNVEPARFALMVALFAAVVFACALDGVHRAVDGSGDHAPRRRMRRRAAGVGLPALVAAVALVLLIPAVPFGNVAYNGTPPYFTSSAVRSLPAGSTAVIFPWPSGAFPPPSVWQAEAGFRFKMAGGDFLVPQGPQHHVAYSPLLAYSANSLTATTLTEVADGKPPAETAVLRSGILSELRAWRVDTVIAVPSYLSNSTAAMGFMQWLFGTPSARPAGAVVWYHPAGA